jgi:hypothetical protein
MNNIEANFLYLIEALANYEYAYVIFIGLAAICLAIVGLIVLEGIEAHKKDQKIEILEAKIDLLLTKG